MSPKQPDILPSDPGGSGTNVVLHELNSAELETMPPILAGHTSPAVQQKVHSFFLSVAGMFDAWVQRNENPNTQRTYRRGVLNFIEHMQIPWPECSHELLQVTVSDVREWRTDMLGTDDEPNLAPSTVNARISALSHFFSFMQRIAVEQRLPIQIPNPAHSQFVGRESTDPVSPTIPLKRAQAHKLLSLPGTETVIELRDRAILATFLYTGIRISTGCRFTVSDFHDDPEDPYLLLREKGRKRTKRRLGIHVIAADAIREYLQAAEITRGPVFRAHLHSRSKKLSTKAISTPSMYRLIMAYLIQLPRSKDSDGTCIFTPHSLRATTATVLGDTGVHIKKVKHLLGHKDIRITDGYIEESSDTKKSASHDVQF